MVKGRESTDGNRNIKPSQEEVKAFFEDHKTNYKTEAMVKVRYLHFNPDTYHPDVTIADEDIKYYYDDNREEFETPKTVEARHILIKADKDADSETFKKTRERAFDIMMIAKGGKDFAELAKKYSEGPSRDRGGSLGAFRKEAMVKPFADMAFSMKAGEISEPVRTRFGWHILKLNSREKARELTIENDWEQIEKWALNYKQQDELNKWLEKLKKETYIDIKN